MGRRWLSINAWSAATNNGGVQADICRQPRGRARVIIKDNLGTSLSTIRV